MNRWLLLFLLATAGSASFVGLAAQEARTVWDGVYTAAQAERGRETFVVYCGGCHMNDLSGQNEKPALKGDNFIERWREYNLESLFTLMKTDMPPRDSRPEEGVLDDAAYLNILTYILQGNAFPAGNAELQLDTLKNVQVIRRTGPEPVPNDSLVLTVGCLIDTGQDQWLLLNATEPARNILMDRVTPEELGKSRNLSLGNHRFRLVNYDFLGETFRLDPFLGHKLLIKGFLIRQPEFQRISVTALEPLADSCGQ